MSILFEVGATNEYVPFFEVVALVEALEVVAVYGGALSMSDRITASLIAQRRNSVGSQAYQADWLPVSRIHGSTWRSRSFIQPLLQFRQTRLTFNSKSGSGRVVRLPLSSTPANCRGSGSVMPRALSEVLLEDVFAAVGPSAAPDARPSAGSVVAGGCH